MDGADKRAVGLKISVDASGCDTVSDISPFFTRTPQPVGYVRFPNHFNLAAQPMVSVDAVRYSAVSRHLFFCADVFRAFNAFFALRGQMSALMLKNENIIGGMAPKCNNMERRDRNTRPGRASDEAL